MIKVRVSQIFWENNVKFWFFLKQENKISLSWIIRTFCRSQLKKKLWKSSKIHPCFLFDIFWMYIIYSIKPNFLDPSKIKALFNRLWVLEDNNLLYDSLRSTHLKNNSVYSPQLSIEWRNYSGLSKPKTLKKQHRDPWLVPLFPNKALPRYFYSLFPEGFYKENLWHWPGWCRWSKRHKNP